MAEGAGGDDTRADDRGVQGRYHAADGALEASPDWVVEAARAVLGPANDGGPPRSVRQGRAVALDGEHVVVLEDGTELAPTATLPPDLPLGYHRLVGPDGGERPLTVAPARAPAPPARSWGWAVQLYSLRSSSSWGIGDLGDLRRFGTWARGQGAAVAMVNPLFAATPLADQEASPYSPTSRRFLNPLWLAVEEVPGFWTLGGALDGVVRAGRAATAGPRVDRAAAFRAKDAALSALWAATAARDDHERAAWAAERGPALGRFGTWCVLAEAHGPDWRRWPEALRHPDRPEVARVAADDPRVDYHVWLQWQCDRQLAAAGAAIGVVQDLPVGVDPGGFDAWDLQDDLAAGFSVGAPPDLFSAGQDWGLPPFLPGRLRASGCRPFAETVRAALRHAAGLRIDHVMGLFRLWWVPHGHPPRDGVYVRYPADELLDVVALEAARAGAFVVGEDLGTVEAGVREELAERNILSYKLVLFEDDPPSRWPEGSLGAVTTHDLPTVAGLWGGADVAEQRRLGLAVNDAGTAELRGRVATVAGVPADAAADAATRLVHRALAAGRSAVVVATLEDAVGAEVRPNVPGTTAAVRPNWSVPLPLTVEELERDPLVATTVQMMREGRNEPPEARGG